MYLSVLFTVDSRRSKFDGWVTSVFPINVISNRLVFETLPTKRGMLRYQCFLVVASAKVKIRPRPAQRLFSNERT